MSRCYHSVFRVTFGVMALAMLSCIASTTAQDLPEENQADSGSLDNDFAEMDDDSEARPGRNRRGAAILDRQPRGQFRTASRVHEKTTHRGHEVKSDHFSVVMPHRDDALEIHKNLIAGWQETSRLLDPVTGVHRRPEFAWGAVQVMVDRRVPTGDDEPGAVVAHQGPQTMIYLPTDFAEASEAEQSGIVQAAAAQALLHTAQLDTKLPAWVCEGLAGYIANQAAESHGVETKSEPLPPIAVANWNADNADRREPVEVSLSTGEALDKVRYLMSGEDGRHAMPFLDAIRETVEIATDHQADKSDNRDLQRKGDAQLISFDNDAADGVHGTAPVDSLFEQLAPRFAAWQKNPNFNQPLVAKTKASPEYLTARDELLVVLKLMRRFDEAKQPVKVKIVGLTRDGKRFVEEPRRAQRYFSLEKIADELQNNESPQAVIDAAGNLVLPHETDRVREVLGLNDRHIVPEWHENRICLATRINGIETLRGWLESNPDDAQRPLAKFELVKRR